MGRHDKRTKKESVGIPDVPQEEAMWQIRHDLKISHINPQVVTDIINKLNERYGKEAPLTDRRGKVDFPHG